MLINGWDEITMIRTRHAGAIAAFERQRRLASPWLSEKVVHHG
jgi:hypothetical protein